MTQVLASMLLAAIFLWWWLLFRRPTNKPMLPAVDKIFKAATAALVMPVLICAGILFHGPQSHKQVKPDEWALTTEARILEVLPPERLDEMIREAIIKRAHQLRRARAAYSGKTPEPTPQMANGQ